MVTNTTIVLSLSSSRQWRSAESVEPHAGASHSNLPALLISINNTKINLNWFNFVYFYSLSELSGQLRDTVYLLNPLQIKLEAKCRKNLKLFVKDCNTGIHMPC